MNKEELIRQFNNELAFALTEDVTKTSNDTIKAVRKVKELLPDWIKKVQEETLKEVLPEEEVENDVDTLESSCIKEGVDKCRQEIINKAKDKWNIIL